MGWLITISGLDGSGKTTLINNLKKRLDDSNISVNLIWLRLGFTPILERIKKAAGVNESICYSPESSAPTHTPQKKNVKDKVIWLAYRLISMTELIVLFSWISIQCAFGKRVISDRYMFDNQIIYQEKYGQPDRLAKIMWSIAQKTAREPDLAIFLFIPPEESYRRILGRNDGIEEQCMEVLRHRASMYDDQDQPGLIKIDGLVSPDKVFNLVWKEMEDRDLCPERNGEIGKTVEKMH